MSLATTLSIVGTYMVSSMMCQQIAKRSVAWDLRRGATLNAVNWPGKIVNKGDELVLVKGRRRVSLILPSGAKYTGLADRIYLGRRDDQLQFIKVHSCNETLDGAAKEAQTVTSGLGVTPDDIVKWHQRTRENEGGALSFTRHYNVDSASFSIKILRSFDDQRPWFVAIEFHFPVRD